MKQVKYKRSILWFWKKNLQCNAVFSQRKGAFKNIFTHNTFTHSAFILIATPKDILVNSNPYNVTRLPPIKSHTQEAKEFPSVYSVAHFLTASVCIMPISVSRCPPPPTPSPQEVLSPTVYTQSHPPPSDVYYLCVLITYQNTCWTHTLYTTCTD